MRAAAQSFHAALNPHRRARALAVAGCALLVAAALGALLLLGVLAADALFTLSDAALRALRPRPALLLPAAGLALALAAVLARRAAAPDRVADALDRGHADPRRGARAALDLARHPSAEGVGRDLADLAVRRAAETLRATRFTDALPRRALQRIAGGALLVLLPAALLLGGAWPSAHTLLARLHHPDAGLPPLSEYTFRLLDPPASVLYDATAELRVSVEGPPVREDVRLLVRAADGSVRERLCFREDERRFGQRLPNVREPIAYAFAIGRARGAWQPLDVVFDPRITGGVLSVAPPAYARLPTAERPADDTPLRALAGSRVELRVDSNRPLTGGELVLRAPGRDARTVAGEAIGPTRVRFTWTVETEAELEARVTDPRGLASQLPLRLRQQIVPDEPPRLSLREPCRFALATPGARLRLEATAEDDLGLARVEWVRALTGYRDRAVSLGPTSPTTRLEEVREIDLAPLGVRPGQTLEFYLEATDSNPEGTGHTLSEVARVRIISEAEYASQLRQRATVADFAGRYRAARGTVTDLREALGAARRAVEPLPAGDPGLEAALSTLRTASEAAADRMQQLFADFPLYDLDEQNQALLGEVAAQLVVIRRGIQALRATDGGLAARLAALEAELAEPEARLREVEQEAEGVAKVARLLRLSRVFLERVAEQQWVVRRIERHADPETIRESAHFAAYARAQRGARENLLELVDALRARAKEAQEVPGAESLVADALAFAERIGTEEIPVVMEAAAVAGDNHRGRLLLDQAREALARLLRLLDDAENSFSAACRGQNPSDKLGERRGPTLGQIGEGMGLGSDRGRQSDGDGYSAGAHTPLNTPMHGPPRQRYDEGETLAGSQGDARGRGVGRGLILRDQVAETSAAPSRPGTRGEAELERTPEKYRHAIRRYFAEDANPETSP